VIYAQQVVRVLALPLPGLGVQVVQQEPLASVAQPLEDDDAALVDDL